MRALLLLLLVPALLSAQQPTAPAALPLDTVLARHVAAIGPIDRIRTRRVASRVSGMAPFVIPVVSEAMRPNLLLKKVTLQGAVQITGFDGRSAWRIDPFASASGKPTDVPAAELDDLIEETDFDGPLMNPAAAGVSLRYVGPLVVSVQGKATPVHAIEIAWANGRRSLAHLHAVSYLEVLRTQRRPAMGSEIAMAITFSDYRRVQGVMVPFVLEIAPEGLPTPIRVAIDSLAFGVALPKTVFTRP